MSRFLLYIILFMRITVPLSAQVDTTIVMSDLIIHGNRISTPFYEASRNIQIILNSDIEKMPVQSIPEVLSYSPGVDIRQRGPVGVQSDIGIRGGTFEQTLILLNGIKLTDPQTGHHILNVPIPLDNIQQIEVLKGPGARIYGQNAFAGAVNFVVKPSEDKKVGIRAYGGSFGSYGGNLSLSLPINNYKQYISLSRDASDGYRHNTDFEINNIFYQAEFPTGNGNFEMIFGMTDRKFGANGFYASPDYTEQYEEVRTSIASISYDVIGNKLKIQPRIYWRWNKDKYLFIRDNPKVYQNLHGTNTIGTEVNASYQSMFGLTGLGIEYRKESINGDWLRGGNATKSNLDGFGRDNFGVYVDHRLKIGSGFDITPGVYTNWYSDFGWNVFPGLDMGYNFSTKFRIYGNVGKSYRIPTFYDQYYSSPIEEGNPDLKPEEAITYEIGLKYLNRGISVETNYFIRDGSQLIDWTYNPVDSIWEAKNFQNVITNGIELSINVNLTQITEPSFPIQNISISYNFLDQSLDRVENVQSRYALEHIKNQVVFGIDHRIVGKLKNNLKLRYIDRIEQEPYLLIDDRLYYELNDRLLIFLEATNLTDQKYTEIMTRMAGIWFRSGVNLDIGF